MIRIQLLLHWIFISILIFGFAMYFQNLPYRTNDKVLVGYPFPVEVYFKVPQNMTPRQCVSERSPFLIFSESRIPNAAIALAVAGLTSAFVVRLIRFLFRKS